MSFLADTCILSELKRTSPDRGVIDWFGRLPDGAISVSVISLAEIWSGIVRLPAGRKRNDLQKWYECDLVLSLETRILEFNLAAATRWAELRAKHPNSPVLDSQIAATAMEYGLTVATRNVRDFAFAGLSVFNPWEA